jgi:ADP-heptose:LPS heptosyltransferase
MFKEILAIRDDRFGEFLLNIPALRALKISFPGSKLTLMVSPAVKELAAKISCVDNILVCERILGLRECFGLAGKLRNRRFDACVVLNPKKEFNLAVFLAGIPVRAGYRRKWGFLLTHKIKDLKSQGLKHEVEYNLDLVKLLGAETADKSLSLTGIPEVSEYRSTIVVHPYTSDPVKQWPIERFNELAVKISRDFNKKVIIAGKASSSIYWGNEVRDLTNKTSLVELAAVLKSCKLLISGDSGPVHLAAAVGTPVIALFRDDLPGKTAKRWGPWGKNCAVVEKSSLNDITVEEVFTKAKQILEN